MDESTSVESSPVAWWKSLGPGFIVAATGVGAGDLIAAAVVGQRYGLVVLWAVALGALLKCALNEGVSRWQLATGTTLIEGWGTRLPRWVGIYFIGYLGLWGFLVAAALAAACGVAATALMPNVPFTVGTWGALHALTGYLLVRWWGYAGFEKLMKILMGIMFVAVVACAVMMKTSPMDLFRGLFWPTIPVGSTKLILGLMGGVGGSVTLLCYGYWLREKKWQGGGMHRRSMFDLVSAYALTGFFGLAVVVIAAASTPVDASGNALVLALADQLALILGPLGKWCFLIGFWCAVFTSLLGVWQGVPYLFADSLATVAKRKEIRVNTIDGLDLAHAQAYQWFLAYLAFPPLLMLWWHKPISIVILYAVTGAFFMPFLASVLLFMNNRREWVGALKNGIWINLLLIFALMLFASLFVFEAWQRFVSA